jgi:hypothetical protein
MSLTLEEEQRLGDVGLIKLFDKNRDMWLSAARKAKSYVRENFPAKTLIRSDDVAKPLIPIMTVNEVLKDYLDSNKLRGRFWITFFVNLIIDRTWEQLDNE